MIWNRSLAKLLAGAGQREAVVVADHALDFDELLLPHVPENSVNHGNGELQFLAEGRQGGVAFQQQSPQHQIENQSLRYPQILNVLRRSWGKARVEPVQT